MNTNRHTIVTAILLASMCMPALATEASSDGATSPRNVSFFNAPGADDAALADPRGVSTYLFVAGSAFNPRSSSQSVTYGGAGCSNSSDAVTTDLQLPDGAEIFGVRTYYYNMGQPGALNTFLTVYDGAGGFTDLLVGSSTLDTGYASEYFAFDTNPIVDNFPQSYVLNAIAGSNIQLCGMRVFYSAP